MSKREIRYLVIIAIVGLLIAGGALFLTDMQRSGERAVQQELSTIKAREQQIDATFAAQP